MRARDLMVGDLFYGYWAEKDEFVPLRVHEILEDRVVSLFNGKNRHYLYDDFEGNDDEVFAKMIPLSAEFLEGNGFKLQRPEFHLESMYAMQDASGPTSTLYALWPEADGSYYLLLRIDGKDMVRINIRWVYQLQHAMNLCGIDKKLRA